MAHDRRHETFRLAYLDTHPIQYHAPFLRRLAAEPDIDLTAVFRSDFSVKGDIDPEFGRFVKWDIDLLGGYKSKFLGILGRHAPITTWRPVNFGLSRELRNGGFHGILLHGYTLPYHLYAIVLAKLFGLRVLVRSDVHALSRHRDTAGKIVSWALFAALRPVVDQFMAVGTANLGYYRLRGIPERKIGWMPYAVDNAGFTPPSDLHRRSAKASVLARLGVIGDRSVLLFASKLIVRKRCADLLRAFAGLQRDRLFPRPLLIVAGDGSEASALRELAAHLKLADDIVFAGFQNQTELPELYWASDIFVLPSENEPWGLVANEAMSAGCAVIVADGVGAAADLVRPGVNGFTFPVGDVSALRDKMAHLLAQPDLLMSAGAASRQIMESWDFEADIAGLRQSLGLATRPPAAARSAAMPNIASSPNAGHGLPAVPGFP